MRDDGLSNRIDRIKSDIKDLKFRQAMGGDSWVVYRTELEFTSIAQHIYKIQFQPDSSGEFVAKSYWTDSSRTLGGIELQPDPIVPGVWYEVDITFVDITRTIFTYSTKKGKIILTDLSENNPA